MVENAIPKGTKVRRDTFRRQEMKILLIVIKNPCKLHAVDLAEDNKIKLNSSKIFFIKRMISPTKQV